MSDLGSGLVRGVSDLIVQGARYPQIPVLLIPTVTSPSLRPSPALMLSREGPDSATHSLCAGSVNTPMLGLLRDVTGFVSVTVAIPARF